MNKEMQKLNKQYKTIPYKIFVDEMRGIMINKLMGMRSEYENLQNIDSHDKTILELLQVYTRAMADSKSLLRDMLKSLEMNKLLHTFLLHETVYFSICKDLSKPKEQSSYSNSIADLCTYLVCMMHKSMGEFIDFELSTKH